MSKSLRSMSESERTLAISRRLKEGKKGLGYWAAHDALHGKRKKPKEEKTKAPKGD